MDDIDQFDWQLEDLFTSTKTHQLDENTTVFTSLRLDEVGTFHISETHEAPGGGCYNSIHITLSLAELAELKKQLEGFEICTDPFEVKAVEDSRVWDIEPDIPF